MKSAYTNNKLLKKYAAGIAGSIFRYLLLLSIGYVILYPMLYLITTSFRPDTAFLDPSRVWIPKSVTLERFAFAAKVMDYFNAFSATVSKELVAAALEVISCAVVGYGFARFNFPFKKVFTAVLFITILVPAPMIVIPQVLNFSRIDAFGILGLINKLTGVDLRANIMGTPLTFYLPSIFASGLRAGILIYIYIQFFSGFPKELEEAAYIDGAGTVRTFLSVMLPNAKTMMITIGLFGFVWTWLDSDFAPTLMYDMPLLSNKFDLIQSIVFNKANSEVLTSLYSDTAVVYTVIPLVILYLFTQKFFVQSVERSGLVG